MNQEQQTIIDSIADGVFTIDSDWKITSFNRAAETITGVLRSQAIGRSCCEVFRASICETNCALKQTMKTGKPLVNKTVYIINSRGRQIPISISTALLKDSKGKVIGGVETFRDLSVVEELRKELQKQYSFADIIGRSSRMRDLFAILPEISESNSTVLLEGASGTGKELFARAIHHLSPRNKKNFVAINCGALPDTLLESELFGYKAGAFTDARKDKAGRFVLADKGTLFLDEIGDISPAMQIRLLRVLQERVFEPLGSVEPICVDVRVIAASNKDLNKLVQKGLFREDLYYRINVIKLKLPPLRDRREDIPLLADHFIAKLNHRQDKAIAGLSPQVVKVLLEYDYPGNVRELENILEHAFVLCRQNVIELNHLPKYLLENTLPELSIPKAGTTLQEMEIFMIQDAIRRNRGNRTLAARELGIDASTLFRKIKRLNIALPNDTTQTHPA
ncbi:MAG: sigma 54-interacting transcriptional regulator [Phycisphaerae bacterium]|nr:sigma 54-interacting transcriptional regulator [Phycisphaerae bacterium]